MNYLSGCRSSRCDTRSPWCSRSNWFPMSADGRNCYRSGNQ